MADKLNFSLVSPARELYAGSVDQVDLPGAEGRFGVLPNHAPFMAALSGGLIRVMENGAETLFFVQGGFADVTAAGLTVLAEKAMSMADMSATDLETEIAAAKAALEGLEGDAAFTAQHNLDGLMAAKDAA